MVLWVFLILLLMSPLPYFSVQSFPVRSFFPKVRPYMKNVVSFHCEKQASDSIETSSSQTTTTNTVTKERLKKVRQHVNPLAHVYRVPIRLAEDWISKSFGVPNDPLIIDVGCSKGTWALKYATMHSNINILGLEIRKPVVEECLRRKEISKVPNVHYMYANANVDIDNIMSSVNQFTTIQGICIQFPDPHFKKRHYKRRVVNEEFVKVIERNLQPSAFVFLQSDILDVCEDMVSHFHRNPSFKSAEGYNIEKLESNPSITNIQTEREIATLSKNLPVYRMLFERIGSANK